MSLFVCKVCGHIEFDAAPEKCPVCMAPQTSFQQDDAAIKQPENPLELSEGDKKHIPQIVIVKECGLIPDGSCTDVHVRVGEIEHVMQFRPCGGGGKRSFEMPARSDILSERRKVANSTTN